MNEEEAIEKITATAQECFGRHPAIVLGSGASVLHGLRSMGDLAQYLRDHIQPEGAEESDAWLLIRTALTNGEGLEEALLKTAAPQTLVDKIVRLTWRAITEDDLALLGRAASGHEHFNLSDLLRGMFKSTHMTINVVTPNYDRVAEYASDIAGYFHVTGFVPGIIRNRVGSDPLSL